MKLSRREWLLGSLASTLLVPRTTWAGPMGGAQRVIFFYFPDGVAGPSQDGDLSKWHAYGLSLIHI